MKKTILMLLTLVTITTANTESYSRDNVSNLPDRYDSIYITSTKPMSAFTNSGKEAIWTLIEDKVEDIFYGKLSFNKYGKHYGLSVVNLKERKSRGKYTYTLLVTKQGNESFYISLMDTVFYVRFSGYIPPKPTRIVHTVKSTDTVEVMKDNLHRLFSYLSEVVK